ncbi:MFS transporter [Alteribacillus iranensis]|uniref:MFS transporter, YNFM family, putative membrane transport protein n=1 Tax=Alteribacillus iranensis TaxID=930128 RepID=A0A1I2AGL6_9BACI|nr:MFS transporter [Alteribacillus iranensis]SFE43032.1 MFS transporter, YNFM family, putative membrane transport protein [Alteribacillus iranensis]
MIDVKTKTFWRATAALGAASLLIFANIYFPQPLLPLFTQEFGISETTSSLTISVALFVLGISFFLYTALSDAYGRRNIIILAMVLGTLGTLAISLAPTFEWLLAARIFQAAALAGIPVAAMAYISEEYKVRAMSVAVGIYISCNSIGGMSGRVISGVLTDLWDWRFAFLVMTILSVFILLLVYFLLPKSKQFTSRPFHLKEVIRDNKNHITDPKMRYAYIIGGLHFFVFIGVFNFITYYLHGEPFQVSTAILGLLFLTYGAGTISSTLAGKAAQKWNQTTCMFIGIAFMATSIALTLIPSFPVIIVALIFLSFGFFFVHSTSSAWVTTHAKTAKASASGLYLTSYYLGGSLGSIYYGWLWPAFGWSGIVAGSMVILCVTVLSTKILSRMEKEERKETRKYTRPVHAQKSL